MDCPRCSADVDYPLMTIEPSAEEDGVEINFTCPYCSTDFYAVLRPVDFDEV